MSAQKGHSHIIRYRSRLYHVQSDDLGLDNPFITTHLFLNGNLVATLRCGYAGMLSLSDLEERICTLMQDQHKEMMRQLSRGELDQLVVSSAGSLEPLTDEEPTPPPTLDPSMTPDEASAIRRGKRISIAVSPLTDLPSGETPIPLDDPAFGGMQLMEWEGEDQQTPLELDVGSLDTVDLGAGRQPAAGEELDLDALFEGTPAPELLPMPTAPKPPPAATASPRPQSPPVEERRGMPRAPRRPRPSLPSLPLATEQVDESFFESPPRTDTARKNTLKFPPPFKDTEQVERESRAHQAVDPADDED